MEKNDALDPAAASTTKLRCGFHSTSASITFPQFRRHLMQMHEDARKNPL
jgi:hypothetical protein